MNRLKTCIIILAVFIFPASLLALPEDSAFDIADAYNRIGKMDGLFSGFISSEIQKSLSGEMANWIAETIASKYKKQGDSGSWNKNERSREYKVG